MTTLRSARSSDEPLKWSDVYPNDVVRTSKGEAQVLERWTGCDTMIKVRFTEGEWSGLEAWLEAEGHMTAAYDAPHIDGDHVFNHELKLEDGSWEGLGYETHGGDYRPLFDGTSVLLEEMVVQA